MPDLADIDSVSQVPGCVGFGDLGLHCSSGNAMAASDFACDVDSEHGGPSLPSGFHLDMPDFADNDSVSQVSDYVNFGEPRPGTTSPGSGYVTAMSDFADDVDSAPMSPPCRRGST